MRFSALQQKADLAEWCRGRGRSPWRGGAQKLRHVNRACETVFVEAVAQMRAAEPQPARALKRLQLRLRRHRGVIEDWVLELVFVEDGILRNLARRIERDEKRLIAADALKQVHPI